MALLLFILLVIIGGCEQNTGKDLTGYYFNREPGDFAVVPVSPDSISIDNPFRMSRGTNGYALAGDYGPVSAFSIFRFSTLLVNFRNVREAYVTMAVDETWSDGDFAFDLYSTVTDWDDSTTIDPDQFLSGIGSPISSFSSSDSTIAELKFDLDVELVTGWTSAGAVLIRNAPGGMGMASIYSDDSTLAPLLNLVRETIPGVLDTTSVTSRDGNYYATTETTTVGSVVSEAAATGFIMDITIPGVVPDLASINRSILTLRIPERFIPLESMPMVAYRLPEKFTTYADVAANLSSGVSFTVEPGTESVDIDIAPFVNYWGAIEDSNYGIMFKPDGDRLSPNTIVFVASDSLSITYTSLPEVN